jgi:predicted XRE-type DNA-binding protein
MRTLEEVYAEAKANLDEERVNEHAQRIIRETRAYRLAELRKRLGLRQTQLAKALGVKQPRISQLEKMDIDRMEVGTLRELLAAQHMELMLVAKRGDECVPIC